MSTAMTCLERFLARENLSEAEAATLMRDLADESLPPALAAGVLVALRAKGETAEEVRGFANAMRGLAHRFPLPDGMQAADTVGTGGDRSGSYNLSTGTGLLAAACGIPVVKHGNRSVSSRSGSADVLEALGIELPTDPAGAGSMLDACNFTFLFAPAFHPAMKAIAPVRRALGARTVFNLLGPLTNPATPPFGLIGAFDLPTAELMAAAVAGMPIQRYFVIHGEPGWDEATPVGPFTLFDVQPGSVRREQRDPAALGVPRCQPVALAGGDAAVNASALEDVLAGRDTGPHRDALALGAGLLLELTGRAGDLRQGMDTAVAVLDAGDALGLLGRLRGWRS